ncbi:N-acetyltransferase [Paractinoplanes abujensis]|uniref:GNAT superfamily N-acetyltransferase n=1 Tax=Paractinoplanes abujensis TaxID=882441 RepID=A0A7W7CZ42_9ACTN|nr:GNAT family N-acetyltransferase [Actinoplanes abujensis]MBB4695661.1 GNAT superfamily N-acetyltransferase [Actinoplanes abujensis]GID23247.1 N-acetyltransferase [Actinoplanes abujensis]
MELAKILDGAATGDFPEPDGGTTIVPQPSARDAGVLAFTAHTVIFLDDDPEWIRATIAATHSDPLAATMNPAFLAALLARTGRTTDTIDLLTVAGALPGPPPLPITEQSQDHPRVRRALSRRDDVRTWTAAGGVLTIGQGVAGRWEVSIEVDEQVRDRGLGRALALAARHLIPPGAVVWSQQAAGNARSIRAFQSAGYRPVGAELLLHVGP